VAPSTELRKWFGHDPAKWNKFQARYREELDGKKDALALLRKECNSHTVTLLYGARDAEHNEALVLKRVLEGDGTKGENEKKDHQRHANDCPAKRVAPRTARHTAR